MTRNLNDLSKKTASDIQPLPKEEPPSDQPLQRFQQYLTGIKDCIKITREILMECKELIFVAIMIYLLIEGAMRSFEHLPK